VQIIYLRPERSRLDARIAARSRHITRHGLQEAQRLLQMNPNPSVRDAVGVREMMQAARRRISPQEAEEKINIRTRQLARRQLRWFDKLIRTLPENTPVTVAETPQEIMHSMHDIICAR
jgi:tRNA dimethylallyltransferase